MPSARTTALVATLAAGAVSAGLALATVTPAAGSTATCQGKPVTVWGTGTDGDDVMVASPEVGDLTVSGAGDDLVCIRSVSRTDSYTIRVDAGPGNDTVVNETADDNIWVVTVLGTGADAYTGSDRVHPASPQSSDFGETVYDGQQDSSATPGAVADAARDTIDTRGGDDVVYSISSAPGAKNQDTITTGAGDDEVHWAGEQAGSAIDLGTGSNRLDLYPGWQATAVAVDAPRGVVTADTRTVLTWRGAVSTYRLQLDHAEQSFVGTDADESLVLSGPGTAQPAPSSTRSVAMAGGDDLLALHSPGAGRVAGGPGADRLTSLTCLEARVRLGGASSCVPFGDSGTEHAFGVDGWEDVQVSGKDVRVVGSAGPETVEVVATARARIRGRGGDDVLNADMRLDRRGSERAVVISGGAGADRVVGTVVPDRLLGGPGDDWLYGDGRGDEILGGPGRDRAYGQHGRDRCAAELRRTCERP